jgi:inorganic pyrophosphatase
MSKFIDLGAIKDKIPINNGFMPVAYGYLPSFINKIEGDPVDVLVFSQKDYATGDKVNVEIFGMFTRRDGDHKILAQDATFKYDYFTDIQNSERKLLLDYFGYNSEIISVDSTDKAKDYLENPELVLKQ